MDNNRPILGASACVWKDGHVLLAKRGKAPNLGLWSLPGGHVELGETLQQAATRELREETSVEAELAHLVDCLNFIRTDDNGSVASHYVVAVFTGNWTAGVAQPLDDAADVAWRTPENLDDLSMTDGVRAVIERARSVLRPGSAAPVAPDRQFP